MKLTLQERFGIKNLLNDKYSKGGMDLAMCMTAYKVIDKIDVDVQFSPKEENGLKKAIKGDEALKVDLKINQMGTLFWDAKKDEGKDIEFTGKEYDLIAQTIKSKSDSKELTLADKYLIELAKKFEIEV